MTDHHTDAGAVAAVEHALAEVQRAKHEGWALPDGSTATPALRKLEEELAAAALALRADRSLEPGSFRGLVKWVSDWIPNLEDPLIAAVARVEQATN